MTYERMTKKELIESLKMAELALGEQQRAQQPFGAATPGQEVNSLWRATPPSTKPQHAHEIPKTTTTNTMNTRWLRELGDEQLQQLMDRTRRELAERERKRRHGSKYILDSRMIDRVRWTQELIPCGNPKCKRCRQRGEFHGPYFKEWRYDEETRRMKTGKPQREAPEGW
jgi:hypothetical protein